MSFMAKWLFPLFGLLLFLLAGLTGWQVCSPIPSHIVRTIGMLVLVGVLAFVVSAMAWAERRS